MGGYPKRVISSTRTRDAWKPGIQGIMVIGGTFLHVSCLSSSGFPRNFLLHAVSTTLIQWMMQLLRSNCACMLFEAQAKSRHRGCGPLPRGTSMPQPGSIFLSSMSEAVAPSSCSSCMQFAGFVIYEFKRFFSRKRPMPQQHARQLHLFLGFLGEAKAASAENDSNQYYCTV